MRSYGQYCALARSLDLVGDRWTLLLVRELLVAPARYGDLQRGLPGIATNLLAQRLRDLEAAALVERDADGRYRLTERGAGLREPVEALVRWGAELMLPGPQGDVVDDRWAVVAVPALLDGRVAGAPSGDVVLAAPGAAVTVRLRRGRRTAVPGDVPDAAARVRAPSPLLLALASGAAALDDAVTGGGALVEGDRALAAAALAR